MMSITFLGATGTVTGSKYLVTCGKQTILVDCGLFQGHKELRLRNWEPLQANASEINAVILTHAHLDHSGYLPLLVKNGYRGKIYCTPATLDLCKILLPDSGHLQEEDALYANRKGFSKHRPALPLYTAEDAYRSLQFFCPIDYGKEIVVGEKLSFHFNPAGHILGSAFVTLNDSSKQIIFSGDLGRPNDLIMKSPSAMEETDYLVLESTYGNRIHDREDPKEVLAGIINHTFQRGGKILIPAFAVGRTQTILRVIHALKEEKRIPNLPVFLDSPMAIAATEILHKYSNEHRLDTEECSRVCATARYVISIEESKTLDRNKLSTIIISAAGMATGGRVLHHLRALAPDPANTILFVGFQAAGTRGASLIRGAKEVKMHGEFVSVRAEVKCMNHFSAHADAEEVLLWLRNFKSAPTKTFITHGEPAAAQALKSRIEKELGWSCYLPKYLEKIPLETYGQSIPVASAGRIDVR